MLRFFIAATLLAPTALFAAGTTTTQPPAKTETTELCENGQLWDIKVEACVEPEDLSDEGKDALEQSHSRDNVLMDAVREFAYAGQYLNAQRALRAMTVKNHDMALTYWGFTHRQLGNHGKAERYYWTALKLNPDNILTRSYLGQGYVAAGHLGQAQKQLREIETRGGVGTWAYASLKTAIETGQTFTY